MSSCYLPVSYVGSAAVTGERRRFYDAAQPSGMRVDAVRYNLYSFPKFCRRFGAELQYGMVDVGNAGEDLEEVKKIY